MSQETKRFIKDVFILALPIGFQFLINQVVDLIDSLMIGSLGEACITAVSVSNSFIWLSNTFVFGIAGGASIIAAQDYGRNETKRIKKLLSLMLVISLIISIGFMLAMTFFDVQIIQIYTDIESVIEPGRSYINIIKYTLFFNMTTQTILSMLRSVRSVKIGLYTSLMSCVFNVFFNWVFIYGHLGFPAMGVAGAALGTLIARIIEFMITTIYLFAIEKNLQYRIKDFDLSLDKSSIQQLIVITLPMLIVNVLNNLTSSVQTMITGRISEYYISANAIVHSSWTLPNIFMMGISMAAGIMIGNSIGAKDYDKARADSKRFVVASFFFGIFGATMVRILVPIISTFYNVTEETLILAKQMGNAAMFSVFFIPFSMVITNGVIKAGGLTDRILKVNIIANWLIAIPLGYICAFIFHLPAAILYVVLRLGNVIMGTWGVWTLKKDDWIHVIE